MQRSWELATAAERDAVEALSVFAGAYTRELGVAVAQLTPTVLRTLIDKSLVQRREDERFASHPLVRQYAASRLATDAERRTSVRQRHAEAVLSLFEDPDRAHEHRPLLEDAAAAWQHAVEHDDLELISRARSGIVEATHGAGRYALGLNLLERARTHLWDGGDATADLRANLRHGESLLLYRSGRHAAAAEAAEDALEAASRAGDRRLMVRSRLALSWARKWSDGDPVQYATIREALEDAEALGDASLLGEVLNGLGCSAPTLEQCSQHLRDGLSVAEGTGDRSHVRLLLNLGIVSWALGDTPEATQRLDEAIGLAESAGSRPELALALAQRAFVHAQSGETAEAQQVSEHAKAAIGALETSDISIYVRLVDAEIMRLSRDDVGAHRGARHALEAAYAVGNVAYTHRALRLDGQLLIDDGEVDEGLRQLAFVLAHTDRRGDFTCEILNPQIWDEATDSVSRSSVENARAFAAGLSLDEVVRAAMARAAAGGPRPQ